MAGGAVTLIEVGPRDGLQNIAATVPTEEKVAYVNALTEAGLPEIEVTAFVSATAIPQLADGAQVLARIARREGTRYTALVPNVRGLERAQEAGVDGVSVFTAASETFAARNINATIEQSISRFRDVVSAATMPVRGYISTAFACPFEGPIAPAAVLRVARELRGLGILQLAISDTIGRATPDDVRRLLDVLLPEIPASALSLHLHDTFGHAIENARAGHDMGIAAFDGSTGGIGGCPFAPGAAGNIATELLAATFPIHARIDPEALRRAARLIQPWRVTPSRSAPAPA